jgi:hypothetical protein
MPPSNEDISQKIAELKRLQSSTRTWRTLTVVGVIAIVVVGLGSVLHQATLLSKDGPEQKEFVDELSAGLQANVLPDLQHLANQTVNEMVPLLKIELQKAADRMPQVVEETRKELAILATELQKKSEKILDATFGDILKKREKSLHQTYPDVDEKKVAQLVENLIKVGEQRMNDATHTALSGHIVALNKIVENLDAIHKMEAPNVSNETPTWEMALLVFDIFRDDLRDVETNKNKNDPTPKTTHK